MTCERDLARHLEDKTKAAETALETFRKELDSGVRLRSCRWECRLVRANVIRLTNYIHLVHEMPSFQSMVHLSLVDHPMGLLSSSVIPDLAPFEYTAECHLPVPPNASRGSEDTDVDGLDSRDPDWFASRTIGIETCGQLSKLLKRSVEPSERYQRHGMVSS
ncbi:MAG: hypothetical protein M1823_001862 [Watsoniomyces obsoletus]|nr:MAG: hypothetical protein M1823_001862 [Watsoniomyces obsoletus]